MLAHYLSIVTILAGVHIDCKDVYISNDGNDDENCGSSFNYSCKSLEYALKHTKYVNTVLLNGGQDTQMYYYINTTILLETNTTFIRYNGSRFKPVITSNKDIFAFRLFKCNHSSYTFSFQSIEFKYIKILQCRYLPCSIYLYDCYVAGQGNVENWRYDDSFISIEGAFTTITKPSNVDVQNCSFYGPKITVFSRTWIFVSIKDSIISGGRIDLSTENGSNNTVNLQITNVMFCSQTCFISVIAINGNIQNIYIVNSKFFNLTSSINVFPAIINWQA